MKPLLKYALYSIVLAGMAGGVILAIRLTDVRTVVISTAARQQSVLDVDEYSPEEGPFSVPDGLGEWPYWKFDDRTGGGAVMNEHTGLCITASARNVHMESCREKITQVWMRRKNIDGSFTIVNHAAGTRCLSVAAPYAVVRVSPCDGSDQQDWKIRNR